MAYDLNGKHVLVTGASSGIGAALAEGFARRGATVGICARRSDRLDAVLARCREHAPDSIAWTVDLADLDGIESFARRASADLDGIDVLVNNAGIPKRKPVFELTPDVIDAVMAINYSSPVRLTLALLDEVVARSGRLVYVSSVAARLSPPSEAAYSASKAALSAWAEGIAVDLRETDVAVHVLYPGVVDTELFTLPDNDPLAASGVEMLPVDAVVEPVLTMIEEDRFETAVPEWFGDVMAGRFRDVGGFIEGTKAFARNQGADGSA